MPRFVDADRRRVELAEVVWRVIRRDGVPGASVRAVAREAGLSMGALRHWFATQDDLLRFAMQLVMQRARARAEAVARRGGPPQELVVRLLEEVLPLDDERRAEAEVWLALTARTLTDPGLAAVRDRSFDELRGLCGSVVQRLADAGALRDGVDNGREAERLHALLDGLTLHLLTRPAVLPPARAGATLRAHLATLLPDDTR